MEGKNQMARILYLMFILTISVVLFVQCGPDSDTVATIGDLEISVDEYKEMLKQRYPKIPDLKDIDEKRKKEILDQAIQKKLKYNAALEMNLDEDPEIVETIRKQEENLLGQKYYESVIVDKLVSEQDIHDFNVKQGYEFKAAHILIGYKNAKITADRTKEEAFELAKTVLKKAQGGEDFSQLVFEYSNDPQAKNPNAKFNSFKWGQRVKEYQNTCWEINVGELSDVIETGFGYYIIRLDERIENPNYVMDESLQSILNIKKILYGAVADSGNKMWKQKVEDLKEEKGYNLNKDAVNQISQLLNKNTKNVNVKAEDFSEEDKKMTLVEWDGGKITFNTIITRYSNNLVRVLRALQDPSKLQRELQNLSLISMAVSEAKKMGLDEDDIISGNLNKLKEDRMSYLVEQKMVNEAISFTDEDVKMYYDENPDQFMDPAKREMWEITLKDEATAKKVANLAKKGQDFEKLARRYSTSKYYKDKGGYLGFRSINSRGAISKKAFAMKPNGQISDPFKYKKEWAVVKTGKVQEKKQRPFKDITKMVEGRLRNELLKEKRNNWNEKLKENFTVKINDEVFKSI